MQSQRRRNSLWCLLVLCIIAYTSASTQSCNRDSDCPLYGDCWFLHCRCKYGGANYGLHGEIISCNNQCTIDNDCPFFADCTYISLLGNRCKCDFGESFYNDRGLQPCSSPSQAVAIVFGVIGTVVFIIIIAALCCFVKRRRRLDRAYRGAILIQPAEVVHSSATAPPNYQAIYPVQQYKQVAPPGYSAQNRQQTVPPAYNTQQGAPPPYNVGYNPPPPYSPAETK